MRKIGTLQDAALLRKAANNREATEAVRDFIKSKVAMMKHLVKEAEKTSGAILNDGFRKELIKKAAAHFPAEWMAGEATAVEKKADALLTDITESALRTFSPDTIYNKRAMAEAAMRKKAVIQPLTDNPYDLDGFNTSPMMDTYAQMSDSELNEVITNLLAETAYNAVAEGQGDSLYQDTTYPVGDVLDNLAMNNPALGNSYDSSDPNMGIYLDKVAAALFDRLHKVAGALERKVAGDDLTEMVPKHKEKETGSAAEETDGKITDRTEKGEEIEGKTKEDLSDEMQLLAESADLEKLLDAEGAEGKDRTNELTSVNAVDSRDAERKVGNVNSALSNFIKRKILK